MLQYYCHIEELFSVPPEAFNPAPQVHSAVVKIVPYTKLPYKANDEIQLAAIVKQAFTQRRKTLRNNLKTFISAAEFEQLNIDPTVRPQEISIQEYVRISNFTSRKILQ